VDHRPHAARRRRFEALNHREFVFAPDSAMYEIARDCINCEAAYTHLKAHEMRRARSLALVISCGQIAGDDRWVFSNLSDRTNLTPARQLARRASVDKAAHARSSKTNGRCSILNAGEWLGAPNAQWIRSTTCT
jgi:hypothetical protein